MLYPKNIKKQKSKKKLLLIITKQIITHYFMSKYIKKKGFGFNY